MHKLILIKKVPKTNLRAKGKEIISQNRFKGGKIKSYTLQNCFVVLVKQYYEHLMNNF